MGSKWAHSTCLCNPNSPTVSLEKHIFDPFLIDFWSQNSPFSRHFVTLEWPKWLAMGAKWAHFTYLGTPNGLGSFLEKHIFDPFFVAKQPNFKAFWELGGPIQATTSSKRAKNTCVGISCGLGSFLKKVVFSHPVDPVDPFWHPLVWATTCNLLQPTGPR